VKTSIRQNGITLLELMITVAIITILAAIAIPAYNGYIKEAQLGVARMNADSLRIFMEDYFLENGSYIVGGDTSYTEAELATNFGWRPDGDNNAYTYAVTAGTNTWAITVEHTSGNWIRCEDRMNNCCDVDTSSASKTACP
jgi:type IV pilus assembly protein PilE